MTDALVIDRADVRYRLPKSRLDSQARLERARAQLFDHALEAAFERAGLLDHELLCIRSLAISLRVPADLSDAQIVAQWSDALTQELLARVRAGDAREVVRYGSIHAALLDMGRSLAREDRRRAWAWSSLELCRASELSQGAGRTAFVKALVARPQAIVGVLGELARSEPGLTWLRSLPAASWIELGEATLRIHAVASSTLELRRKLTSLGSVLEVEPNREALPSITTLAVSIERSCWLELARPFTRDTGDDTHVAIGMLLALALLEASPLVLARTLDVADTLVQLGLHLRVLARTTQPTAPSPYDIGPIEPRRQAPWTDPHITPKPHATTHWAGLLFLYPLLRDADLWSDLASLADAHALGARHIVHALACVLAPAASPADAGLLAFAGLPPDAEVPRTPLDSLREPLTAIEARLIAELERRVPVRDHRPARGRALLDWLLRRFAEVHAAPGWLELRLPLREVDTDIRRAGLDLDPDWIPELGVIVKFVYV